MGKKRIVYSDTLNHCYQRAADKVVLFYSVSDFLSFFTMFCIQAARRKVCILALCLMYDHFHTSAKAKSPAELSSLMNQTTSIYSRQNNNLCHRKGQLFQYHFGSAPKKTEKAIRTNIVYVGNNSVERKITKKAEEYRWNFLAYAKSDHPFSEPLVIRRASWPMKNAVSEVKAFHGRGQHLTYQTLQRLFAPLSHAEKEQLVDFIISTYNVIDYDAAIRYFGSYENMLEAMHVTTGSEYDIKEHFTGWTDECYPTLVKLVLRKTGLTDIHEMFALNESRRRQLMEYLKGRTDATDRQLEKFLRI